MTATFRQWIAALLLVCLPLQVFASMNVVSCAGRMPHCPGMQTASSGCCDHAQHNSVMNHGINHGGHSQHDMSPCEGANTCAPSSAMAALPSVSQVLVLPSKEAWSLPDPHSYLSYIPDGPHRPPTFLA